MRLISPILTKETTQLATGRGLLVAKCFVLGNLLGTALLLLVFRHFGRSGGNGDDSEMGLIFFYAVAYVELTGLLLVAPLITAGCVCGEREANTLGLLFLTRLNALQIVQDKGLSRLLFLLMLISVSLPFLFAALLFGGVETTQVVNVFGNLLAAILLAGGCGLFASAWVRRYPAALVIAYVLLALWLVGLPMAIGVGAATWRLLSGSSPDGDVMAFLFALTHPYASIGMAAAPSVLRSTPMLAWSWVGTLASGAAVYVLAVTFGAWRLRALATDDALPEAPREGRPWWWLTRDLWRWLALLHPLWLLPRARRPLGNAIYWKEAQGRHDPLKNIAANLAVAVALVPPLVALGAGVIFSASMRDLGGGWQFTYFLSLPLATLLLLVLAAAAISRERHGQTLEVLLTTRINGGQMVRGHLRELLKYAVVLGLLSYGYYLLGVLYFAANIGRTAEWGQPLGILQGPLLLPLCLAAYFLFIIAVGLTCSLGAKTTGRALARTMAVLLGIGAVPLMPLPILVMLDYSNGETVSLWLLSAWPPFWLTVIGIHESYMLNKAENYWGWLLALNLLLYGGGASYLLVRLARRFDRLVGRQGE